MFEQAVLAVQDEARFRQVKQQLEQLFAHGSVALYLRRLERARMRARDFEGALARGFLGRAVAESYAGLQDSDRGQVRELYLRLVEQVPAELRAKYLKVYAYY